MKNFLIICISIFHFNLLKSQCLDGDCENGIGIYRFSSPVNSVFQGNFLSGLPSGKGKIDYIDWNVTFEGNFVNGEIDSTSVGVLKRGDIIKEGLISERTQKNNEGQIVWNWVLNGSGCIKYSNGKIVEKGNFYEDNLNGVGERILNSEKGQQIELGNFIDGELNDEYAEIVYFDGDKYIGGVVNGKPQGKGKLITPSGGIKLDGTWFEGEWLEANKNNPYGIPLQFDGKSLLVDVDFESVKISMIVDSGASLVTINKTQFFALTALNLIKIKNVEDGSFQIANGELIEGKIYTIDKMKLGSYVLENVECSVLESFDAPNLLGLNALLKPTQFFSIDLVNLNLNF